MVVAIFASMFAMPVSATELTDEEILSQLDSVEETPAGEQPALVNVIEPGTEQTEPGGTTEPDNTAEPGQTTDPDNTAEPDDTVQDASDELPEQPELDGDPEECTVSYYSAVTGGTLLKTEKVAKGECPKEIPADDGAGKTITTWVDKDGALVDVEKTPVEADVDYYAWFRPQLNSSDHMSYVDGTGKACFSPNSNLTRGAAAKILYSLLTTTELGPYPCEFTDVQEGKWYTTPVKVLASYGVLTGDGDGTFRPGDPVRRSEFVAMLVRITGVTGGSSSFTDVKTTHWAYDAINAAASREWVNGFGDNTFQPNAYITRAQAVKVVNRVLQRHADEQKLASGTGIRHFIDVPEGAWFYADVMEASIGHVHTGSGESEAWTTYNTEKSDLAPGVHNLGSVICCVDEHQQPVYMEAGISKLDGKFYYAKSAGYSCDAELNKKAGYAVFANGTEQKLADKFNRIGNTLFHWNLSSGTATALNKGLNNLADASGSTKTYWAEKSGYNVFINYGEGAKVVQLDGKKYLTDGYCAIVTSTLGYTKDYFSKAERDAGKQVLTRIDLKNRTYELVNTNGSDIGMFYIQSDYTIATNAWKGYLYFGSDGKYTSGDATLDAYVWNYVKGFINNNGLSQGQKLLKAYYTLRGGEGAVFVDNGFKYSQIMSSNPIRYYTMVQRGRYNGQFHMSYFIDCAKEMYSTYRGMCYQWGAGYLYMARRLGFQAYPVVGGLWSSNNTHCWNMIKWDGVWHISDVEIEWGHLCGHYAGGKVYRNLFEQALSSEWVSKYVNPECGISYTFP